MSSFLEMLSVTLLAVILAELHGPLIPLPYNPAIYLIDTYSYIGPAVSAVYRRLSAAAASPRYAILFARDKIIYTRNAILYISASSMNKLLSTHNSILLSIGVRKTPFTLSHQDHRVPFTGSSAIPSSSATVRTAVSPTASGEGYQDGGSADYDRLSQSSEFSQRQLKAECGWTKEAVIDRNVKYPWAEWDECLGDIPDQELPNFLPLTKPFKLPGRGDLSGFFKMNYTGIIGNEDIEKIPSVVAAAVTTLVVLSILGIFWKKVSNKVKRVSKYYDDDPYDTRSAVRAEHADGMLKVTVGLPDLARRYPLDTIAGERIAPVPFWAIPDPESYNNTIITQPASQGLVRISWENAIEAGLATERLGSLSVSTMESGDSKPLDARCKSVEALSDSTYTTLTDSINGPSPSSLGMSPPSQTSNTNRSSPSSNSTLHLSLGSELSGTTAGQQSAPLKASYGSAPKKFATLPPPLIIVSSEDDKQGPSMIYSPIRCDFIESAPVPRLHLMSTFDDNGEIPDCNGSSLPDGVHYPSLDTSAECTSSIHGSDSGVELYANVSPNGAFLSPTASPTNEYFFRDVTDPNEESTSDKIDRWCEMLKCSPLSSMEDIYKYSSPTGASTPQTPSPTQSHFSDTGSARISPSTSHLSFYMDSDDPDAVSTPFNKARNKTPSTPTRSADREFSPLSTPVLAQNQWALPHVRVPTRLRTRFEGYSPSNPARVARARVLEGDAKARARAHPLKLLTPASPLGKDILEAHSWAFPYVRVPEPLRGDFPTAWSASALSSGSLSPSPSMMLSPSPSMSLSPSPSGASLSSSPSGASISPPPSGRSMSPSPSTASLSPSPSPSPSPSFSRLVCTLSPAAALTESQRYKGKYVERRELILEGTSTTPAVPHTLVSSRAAAPSVWMERDWGSPLSEARKDRNG